jgi:hypothetical protein
MMAVKRGDVFLRPGMGVVKVMAVADNYIMARVPHCVPFVVSVKYALEHWIKEEPHHD